MGGDRECARGGDFSRIESPTSLMYIRPTRLTADVIIARMAAWSEVTVPRKSYRFPAICPDCLRTGPFTGVSIPAALRIQVPFCELCASRQGKRRKLGRPLLILAVGFALAITLWFGLSKWVGCWLAVILVLPTVWLTDYRDRVVRIKSFDANNVTFEFKRSEYAQQFERQ